MNDAGYRDLGMILHTNSFTKTDVMLLISVLDSNFGIKATIRVAGKKWVIYVPAAYMPTI
jgi:LAGLIDADG DNA endonuclease family